METISPDVTRSSVNAPQSSSAPSVVETIDLVAARHPDEVAVSAGGRSLSYSELVGTANRAARYLRSLGAGTESVIALCLPRSLELAAAALGILKSGGAYLPLDPSYPVERLRFAISDAEAPILITNREMGARLTDAGAKIVVMEEQPFATLSAEPLETTSTAADLAYTIYTSGSTGAPKGVEIPHAGLSNLVAWHNQAFGVTPQDRASHLAGLGFDAAVWELWPYLCVGASVHFTPEEVRTSPELLRDWLVAENITISFVPTPVAERILTVQWPSEAALRILLTGGDTLHRIPVRGLRFQVINNYGPTECTVVATSGAVDPNAPEGAVPTIGWPIRNTRIHLLDEQMRKVAPGTPGEIYIESASIARGYRNSPQLTAERFLPNPFYDESTSPDPQNPAEFARRRLYRTGDLARELPDGQLVFLGRVDDQVKIRGNRIEPQEIVAWLNRHPAVKESRVIAQAEGPGTGEKRLIAYLCATPGAAPTPSELRKWLSEHLPEYMIPAAFVRVEAFPLTPNGKIDVAALPPPGPDNVLEEPRTGAPRTPMEQHVAQMIGNLLKLDHIEAEDNFFLLGGHSMLGAQLIARINQDFQAQITLRDLFAAPTVRALAREIERALANAKSAAAAQSAGFTQQDKGGGR